MASDSYFQNPERYYIDTKPLIDKKKLSHLFDRYKGRPTNKIPTSSIYKALQIFVFLALREVLPGFQFNSMFN